MKGEADRQNQVVIAGGGQVLESRLLTRRKPC